MTVRTIVVGTDGSEGAAAAVRWTAELAAPLGAKVVLVHAFDPIALLGKVKPPFDMAALAATARVRLVGEWASALSELGVAHDGVLVEGIPAAALLAAADEHEADLIVVGARGLGAVRAAMLGSTSRRLTHDAHRPVCVIPAVAG